jgi:hypothetical protein
MSADDARPDEIEEGEGCVSFFVPLHDFCAHALALTSQLRAQQELLTAAG